MSDPVFRIAHLIRCSGRSLRSTPASGPTEPRCFHPRLPKGPRTWAALFRLDIDALDAQPWMKTKELGRPTPGAAQRPARAVMTGTFRSELHCSIPGPPSSLATAVSPPSNNRRSRPFSRGAIPWLSRPRPRARPRPCWRRCWSSMCWARPLGSPPAPSCASSTSAPHAPWCAISTSDWRRRWSIWAWR